MATTKELATRIAAIEARIADLNTELTKLHAHLAGDRPKAAARAHYASKPFQRSAEAEAARQLAMSTGTTVRVER